jgi:hypothetical protein
MARKRTELAKVKSLLKNISKNTYLPEFYKKQLSQTLNKCIDFSLKKPSVDQEVSDRFYVPSSSQSLMSGDIIDLKKLDVLLSAEHKAKLEGKKYSEAFYPYFFKTYDYGVIATQTCKLEHGKVHVIEICAVKPITKIIHHLLSGNSVKARDKFVYKQDDVKPIKDNFRKLIDQQRDEYFFYPAKFEKNTLVTPPLVACIDIKIPVRHHIHGKSHVEQLLKSRVYSIDSLFQAKLGEKLGKYYINVALEDTSDLFTGSDFAFERWTEDSLEKLLPFMPDKAKKTKDQIRKFIRDTFAPELSLEDIWDTPAELEKILKFTSKD